MRPILTNTQDLHLLFRQQLELCNVQAGETIACLSDRSTRREYVEAAFSAATAMGANIYELGTNAVPSWTRVGIETVGACKGTVDALKASDLLTCFHVPLFTKWLKQVRDAGTRVQMIVDHPDDLSNNQASPGMKAATVAGSSRLRAAKKIRFTNEMGTDFSADTTEFDAFHQYGFADEPGHFDHWGAGHLYTFPNEGSASGRVVIQPGDLIVLPYNNYVRDPIEIEVRDGFVREIKGDGHDARLMRYWLNGNMKHKDDLDGFAISHLGWGTNPYCRWDNMELNGSHNDRNNGNARGLMGSFLWSTGPNTQGGGKRATTGHYDVPMMNCDVYLDEEKIIEDGVFLDKSLESPREDRGGYLNSL